jgi:hypothetical protein
VFHTQKQHKEPTFRNSLEWKLLLNCSNFMSMEFFDGYTHIPVENPKYRNAPTVRQMLILQLISLLIALGWSFALYDAGRVEGSAHHRTCRPETYPAEKWRADLKVVHPIRSTVDQTIIFLAGPCASALRRSS